MQKNKLFFLIILFLASTGCRKFITVDPPVTSTTTDNIFRTNGMAVTVLSGIFTKISGTTYAEDGLTSAGIALFTGLSGDELKLLQINQTFQQYYHNDLLSAQDNGFWKKIYPIIFLTNSAIEGLSASSTLTPAVKNQLLGEAKFVRAMAFFYLVNFYGNVPLTISTDYVVNASMPRTSADEVYKQIITDLQEAKSSMSEKYLMGDALTPYPAGGEERIRPTTWAASALLARVYLYSKNYEEAEAEASRVISQQSLFNLTALNNVFLKNSDESILQWQPIGNGINSQDANTFMIPNSTALLSVAASLSDPMMESFEADDQRKEEWTASITIAGQLYHYASKYKVYTYNNPQPVTEYTVVFRLGELFLIRAEARMKQGMMVDAISDLDKIRDRAGLPGYSGANDEPAFSNAIIHERRSELFTEWGHRWLDLKRLELVDAVMTNATAEKGGTWKTTAQWYPLPAGELLLNPALTQNDGYN
jgi:starch-binding outer membrane protein, SusD/RagB family